MPADVIDRTTAHRHQLADVAASLTHVQLETPSLCQGWTVRHVVAHSVMHLDVSAKDFFAEVFRQRGSVDAASDVFAKRLAERPVEQLVHTLRTKADTHLSTPLVGPLGPFTDACVHLRDVARPLGLDADVPADDWREVLGFLVTRKAQREFVRPGRLDHVRLVATDVEWSWGQGVQHTGTAEELAMAVCGRIDYP